MCPLVLRLLCSNQSVLSRTLIVANTITLSLNKTQDKTHFVFSSVLKYKKLRTKYSIKTMRVRLPTLRHSSARDLRVKNEMHTWCNTACTRCSLSWEVLRDYQRPCKVHQRASECLTFALSCPLHSSPLPRIPPGTTVYTCDGAARSNRSHGTLCHQGEYHVLCPPIFCFFSETFSEIEARLASALPRRQDLLWSEREPIASPRQHGFASFSTFVLESNQHESQLVPSLHRSRIWK